MRVDSNRVNRACFAAVVAGMVLVPHGAAYAEAPRRTEFLKLDWVAPAECPTGEDVEEDVVHLLGPSPNSAETVTARARVSKSADGRWHVKITTTGASGGERKLDAPSCKAAATATALVLALRIDPTLLTKEPPPEPPPTPPPAPVEPAPPPPPPGPTHEAVPSWSVAALVAGTVNQLPSPNVAGELVVAWAPTPLAGRLRLELHGEGGPAQDTTTTVGQGTTRQVVPSTVVAAGGGIRGCFGPTWGDFSVLGCGGAELDWMHVAGTKPTPTSQSATWATLEGGAQGRWRVLRRLAIRVDASALVPLGPPEFVVQDTKSAAVIATVSKPGAVWARVGVGVEVLLF